MTVQEVHKEYNSLTDQIQAKYKLLDSGKCGAFNAESSELVHLSAHMSKLCRHLNLKALLFGAKLHTVAGLFGV